MGDRFGPAWKAEAARVLWDGNKRDRFRGVDRRSARLVPWKWRLERYRGQEGPTLLPFGERSRAIRCFFVEWNGDLMTAGFRGAGVEVLAYHAAGKSGKGRPIFSGGQAGGRKGKRGREVVGFVGVKGQVTGIVRDVLGVSAATRAELIESYRQMVRQTFTGRIAHVARQVASRVSSVFGMGAR